jgi:hypothetical protein
VAATVESSGIPPLLALLSDGAEAASEADFVARLDGEAHAYLFVFSRETGPSASERLAASLHGSRIPFTTGVISSVRSFAALLRDAQKAQRDH